MPKRTANSVAITTPEAVPTAEDVTRPTVELSRPAIDWTMAHRTIVRYQSAGASRAILDRCSMVPLPAWHPHVDGGTAFQSYRTRMSREPVRRSGPHRCLGRRAAECTEGSVPLFLVGAAPHLFATTSMGIVMAMLAPSIAAVCPAHDPAPDSAADPLRWPRAAREHAGARADPDARGAADALHGAGPGDSLRRAGHEVVWRPRVQRSWRSARCSSALRPCAFAGPAGRWPEYAS
jgi:hypothetical protein